MRPPRSWNASRKKAPMKWGCSRRAWARSISSRIAATAFGSIPSDVSLRSATSCSMALDVHGVVDLLEQLGLGLGRVAVADGFDQQVAQRLALEQLAQHVEDLAAERGLRASSSFSSRRR